MTHAKHYHGALSPRASLKLFWAARAGTSGAVLRFPPSTLAFTRQLQVLSRVELPAGIIKEILRVGAGDLPPKGSTVTAHYTGTLLDGTVFDSSHKRGKPFQVRRRGAVSPFPCLCDVVCAASRGRVRHKIKEGNAPLGVAAVSGALMPPAALLKCFPVRNEK